MEKIKKFKRIKTLVHKKRFAPKGKIFFIVEYQTKHKVYKLSLLLDCAGKTDETEELLFMKMETKMGAELAKAGVK